jgi:hypothetical protein
MGQPQYGYYYTPPLALMVLLGAILGAVMTLCIWTYRLADHVEGMRGQLNGLTVEINITEEHFSAAKSEASHALRRLEYLEKRLEAHQENRR